MKGIIMKKTYNKPEIIFDDVALSTDIAGNCAYIATFDNGSCPIRVEGFNVVIFSETSCEVKGVDGENVCYHAPGDDMKVFSS